MWLEKVENLIKLHELNNISIETLRKQKKCLYYT